MRKRHREGTWREYDSDGYVIEGLHYSGREDRDEPLLGIAKARAKFIDQCWCGNRKHADRPLCSVCQVVIEKDAKK